MLQPRFQENLNQNKGYRSSENLVIKKKLDSGLKWKHWKHNVKASSWKQI